MAYWGVSDAQAAFDRLISPRATQRSTVQDVGGRIRVTSVFDPFGNIFGIIGKPRISRFPRHDGKSPHSVTFVKELPKTATGKIREIHFASAPACDRSPVSTLISKRVSGICFLLTR